MRNRIDMPNNENNETLVSLLNEANDPAHLDPEEIADYLTGVIIEQQRAHMEAHLATCRFCIHLLADLAPYVLGQANNVDTKNTTVHATSVIANATEVVREVMTTFMTTVTGFTLEIAEAHQTQTLHSNMIPSLGQTDGMHEVDSAGTPTDPLVYHDHATYGSTIVSDYHPVADVFSMDNISDRWNHVQDLFSGDSLEPHHGHVDC